jgi:putative toxin-antitoxin system antitoxin component (TIGR02293 family)
VGILPVINLLKRLEEMLEVEHLGSEKDLIRLIEDRLPTRAVQALRTAGFTDDEVYTLVLPRRTFSHRVAKRERLSLDESDRIVRILRVAAFGESVFGEPERFWHWFRAPKRRFEGRSPMSLLTTAAGGRVVEDLLGAIDEGFAA